MNEMKIKVELNVCRVCLQNSNVDFESLFDETKKYGEKFKYSTSINVRSSNRLVTTINLWLFSPLKCQILSFGTYRTR